MKDNAERLKELQQLETLTDAEMEELVRLSPKGAFKAGPNLLTVGVVDVGRAFQNYKDAPNRSQHAYEHGCFIEVISLIIQHMDFWSRLFWVARNGRGQVFEKDDKRPFGTIIKDCEKHGFDKRLVDRMRSFNKVRVDAIHKYLLGAICYQDLKEVCDAYRGLDREVAEYVMSQIGIPMGH